MDGHKVDYEIRLKLIIVKDQEIIIPIVSLNEGL